MKNLIIAACVFAPLFSFADPAYAGTVEKVLDRQCSAVNIPEVKAARFAASVGIMTTDPKVRKKLFSGFPYADGSERCAFVISESFCKQEYFDFVKASLTTTMATNPGSNHFFTVLDAQNVSQEPKSHAFTILGGTAGALGGLIAGEGALEKIGKGALYGGIGAGVGSMADTGLAKNKCDMLQAKFANFTSGLVQRGLKGYSDDTRLYTDIWNFAVRHGDTDVKRFASAMITAMDDTADRIESYR